jgi:hypothetical protein
MEEVGLEYSGCADRFLKARHSVRDIILDETVLNIDGRLLVMDNSL